MFATDTHAMITPLPVASDQIPAVMPSPFAYAPHPLAEQAALLLQQRLSALHCDYGKMFGVLVVQNSAGEIGFLSAFSGMFNGQWQLPGFVPPIFNQQEQESFLPAEKETLKHLTTALKQLEAQPQRATLQQLISELEQQRDQNLAELKQQQISARAERKQQRLQLDQLTDSDAYQAGMRALALASQQQKRALSDAKKAWLEMIDLHQSQLDKIEAAIESIRDRRATLSRQLHQRVFATYQLHNFCTEQLPLSHFFKDATPPAGAGDCAGPKLIHYAHQHQLQPLAMAEFWWGASPSTGVRHHGQFYPACRGKCRPILPFMLTGLEVEAEPDFAQDIATDEPRIVFEDESLIVVNKPAGLMSVPGKKIQDCVYNRLLQRYPQHPELRLVHRLDMATSGLLLVAKNLRANKLLQRQFIKRSVEKCYVALLEKRLETLPAEGEINLPLRVDLDDHPRQMVCLESGRSAITRWQIIGLENDHTRIRFHPLTGRTHQLRLHAAHRDGLNAAIIGDALYGRAGERLMLHAERLCFTHPLSRERMEFKAATPF